MVLSSVVVNYRTGDIEFTWKHGGWSRLTYAWSDQETTEPSTPFGLMSGGRRTTPARPARPRGVGGICSTSDERNDARSVTAGG